MARLAPSRGDNGLATINARTEPAFAHHRSIITGFSHSADTRKIRLMKTNLLAPGHSATSDVVFLQPELRRWTRIDIMA